MTHDALPDDIAFDEEPADHERSDEQPPAGQQDSELPDELPPEIAAELGIDIDEFADEAAAAEQASHETGPALGEIGFYDAGPDLHALDGLNLQGRIGVLERLGPAHFRSKGFSFIGFLQTVYEHVAGEVATGGTAVLATDAVQDEESRSD